MCTPGEFFSAATGDDAGMQGLPTDRPALTEDRMGWELGPPRISGGGPC